MKDHDPRIVALAKDHRAGPLWRRLLAVGHIGGPETDFLPFARACREHGLSDLKFAEISAALLAYVRSVADGLVSAEVVDMCNRWNSRHVFHQVALPDMSRQAANLFVLNVLRGDDCRAWPATAACRMTDTMVDAGLLTPDEEPSPLELTTIGHAVMLVLETKEPA